MSVSKVAALLLIGGLAAQTLVAQATKAPSVPLEGLKGVQGLEAFKGLEALKGLESLKGLEGLEALQGLEGIGDLDLRDPITQQGPADSLYRVAREELNAGRYQRAAELFQRVWERYPRQEVAGDAMYWAAFARYQTGGNTNLQRALRLLSTQADRYPSARTRRDGDVLATRIRGELARLGNAEAAESVFVRAAPPAPAAPGAPTAPR